MNKHRAGKKCKIQLRNTTIIGPIRGSQERLIPELWNPTNVCNGPPIVTADQLLLDSASGARDFHWELHASEWFRR